MTATNINIQEFIHVLTTIQNNGTKMINLDMIQDEEQPTMNKLIIHPVPLDEDLSSTQSPERKTKNKIVIRNPNINPENNDIFNAFNDIV